jgi:phospholipid/cholesterol/gamma-HCH transport system permease protein
VKSTGTIKRRILVVLLVGATCLAVIAPWWVRNLTTFENPVFLATGHGSVLQSANCDQTYSGPFVGYWNIECITAGRPPEYQQQRDLMHSKSFPGVAYLLAQDPRDESVADLRARTKAVNYIEDHLTRAPLVAAARVGRVWGFFRVQQEVDLDVFFERRGHWPSWAGTWMYYALVAYGAAESLGLIVNLALVRELGPVVTALLFAGRAGTSLTAEIGLMKAGEQLSAMEMMAIDPRARVLAPRFLGGIVSMPILAVLFSTVGILGAYVVAVLLIGVDQGNFWSIMQNKVDVWRDVGNGVAKSAAFGVVSTAVALYQGYETQPTPEGVAYATTRTVVISSLSVLSLDFVLTALMFSTP